MTLEPLKDGLLYVIVFGPGFGESIVVRIPGTDPTWIIVDGCRTGSFVPAAKLLEEYGAKWSCVVLTHPHLDHALGLDAVLDHPGSGPIGCAALSVPDPVWNTSPDPDQHIRSGTLEHVVAAIHTRWLRKPESKWVLRRGDARTFGTASMTALHPDARILAQYKKNGGDANRLATPLLLEWNDVRVLLGSDVLRADWNTIGTKFSGLANHAMLKVPHHGSHGARHDTFGRHANRDRIWIVTPFNRGQGLPRFEDNQGLHWILQQVDRVHLTGLPVAYDLQGAVPFKTTRQDLRDGKRPLPALVPLLPGLMLKKANIPEPTWNCYVAVGFDQKGQPADVRHGAGALVVEERKPKLKK